LSAFVAQKAARKSKGKPPVGVDRIRQALYYAPCPLREGFSSKAPFHNSTLTSVREERGKAKASRKAMESLILAQDERWRRA